MSTEFKMMIKLEMEQEAERRRRREVRKGLPQTDDLHELSRIIAKDTDAYLASGKVITMCPPVGQKRGR